MEKVYNLHQHTHCVVTHIGKDHITINIFSNSNRSFTTPEFNGLVLLASTSYNKHRTDIIYFDWDYIGKDKEVIVFDNFRDGLYNLFKKDKKTWVEEDSFLMKAVSDFLLAAVRKTVEEIKLEIESFDLFHYAFVVPSEWEEEIRDGMIRPIFVQSGLISDQDHRDRLLFFTDIEAICYRESFERGENTILCRITPEEEGIVIKFDLIQTATTLFNFPSAKLFPKVIKSSSVPITKGDIEDRIKGFLKENLFPVSTSDDGGLWKSIKSKLISSYQNQIIEDIIEELDSWRSFSWGKENKGKGLEEPWITIKRRWMLSESQKEFINSLCPSIICAEFDTFLLGYIKDIISNNFTKSYGFLLVTDCYSETVYRTRNDVTWVKSIFECNRSSLNSIVTINRPNPWGERVETDFILEGAGKGVFEAIQHSDIYCEPCILSSIDLATSLSVFINSKPNTIINLDISLRSTFFTCSVLDEEGLIQQIYNHDYFIQDMYLPPLENFYTFSNTTTLKVKEKFIPFAERYLLGDLSDFTVDDDVTIKKGILLEMKAILANDLSNGEVLVSTDKQKYIKAFILMYMIYIKEEILYKFLDQLMSDKMDMKIGYAVSIEAILLNNMLESKDNLRDIIYASGLVPKDDNSKKLRITTQGERILPAIQKSLKLEFSLRSYFLLCQLHEDYVQLSLHQVVTEPSPEEKEQESIIVQDEVFPIQNIYDSLCSSMWCNLLQDSSLIELCEMHDSKILDLFSLRVKTEFFANLKGHISDNILQNKPGMRSTNTVKLTSSCNCKVRLAISDIIDISFIPLLQDIARTLSASLLNNDFFGKYMNIDYLFSFIHFNSNPQLQYAFARILEEEAEDFNLGLGIDTSCLVVPELFNPLLQPVIAQRPFCYKDFKIGVLQQVCSENYVACIIDSRYSDDHPVYKSKKTDTKAIECDKDIVFPFIYKGDIINNVGQNRRFYLRNKMDTDFERFNMVIYRFKTMKYLANGETLSLNDNIYQQVDYARVNFDEIFERKDVDIPVMVSVRYVSYTSSLQLSARIVGADTRNRWLMDVVETGEPLTLTRL